MDAAGCAHFRDGLDCRAQKAEGSVSEELAAIAAPIAKVISVQKQTAEGQGVLLEEQQNADEDSQGASRRDRSGEDFVQESWNRRS